MLRAVRLKFLFLFILTVIAIIFVLPSLTGTLPPWWEKHVSRGLNLGLDLKGGMHLILQVDMDQAVSNALSRTATELKETAEKRGLDLKVGDVAKQSPARDPGQQRRAGRLPAADEGRVPAPGGHRARAPGRRPGL